MTVLTLLALRLCNMFQIRRDGDDDDGGIQVEQIETNQRVPLLPGKDDDLSSWGSSYDSVSHDEEDLEERFMASSKAPAEGENSSNQRALCVICFNSPRDCFFLPCGHSAACFDCGSRYTLHLLEAFLN